MQSVELHTAESLQVYWVIDGLNMSCCEALLCKQMLRQPLTGRLDEHSVLGSL